VRETSIRPEANSSNQLTREGSDMPKKDKDEDAWFARACENLGMSLWLVMVILGLGVLGGYMVSRFQ
jgi:hypothetical protein